MAGFIGQVDEYTQFCCAEYEELEPWPQSVDKKANPTNISICTRSLRRSIPRRRAGWVGIFFLGRVTLGCRLLGVSLLWPSGEEGALGRVIAVAATVF